MVLSNKISIFVVIYKCIKIMYNINIIINKKSMKNLIIKLNTTEAIDTANQVVDNITNDSRIVVNSQPTFDKAKSKLGEIKEIKKVVKDKKESITKPLNEALKNTRDMFKPIEDKTDVIEKYLKDSILKYHQKLLNEQKRREEEAQKKIEEEQKKGNGLNELNINKISKPLTNVTQKVEKIKTRKVKKLKINNEQIIPRGFLIPNETKIKEALFNGLKVDGCEIVEEEIAINNY